MYLAELVKQVGRLVEDHRLESTQLTIRSDESPCTLFRLWTSRIIDFCHPQEMSHIHQHNGNCTSRRAEMAAMLPRNGAAGAGITIKIVEPTTNDGGRSGAQSPAQEQGGIPFNLRVFLFNTFCGRKEWLEIFFSFLLKCIFVCVPGIS